MQLDATPITLTVFWCGTSGNKDLPMTQIELFGQWCRAIDLSELDGDIALVEQQEPIHYKLRFDGCGHAFGFMGVVFGAGLSQQASLLKSRVSELIELYRRRVVVNLVGLSRGAVACLIAAKKLAKFDSAVLKIHMLAFDPVPGNFVTSAKLDFLHITHAWANMDLRDIPALDTALLLYPYEALPDVAVHAPMIPIFDPGVATYDVILGCHQGAMWNHGHVDAHIQSLDTWISATLIKNFLISHGTVLERELVDRLFPSDDAKLLQHLDAECAIRASSERSTHSYGSIKILRVQDAPFLNKFHAILQQQSQNGAINEDWTKKTSFYSNPLPDDLKTNLKFSKDL